MISLSAYDFVFGYGRIPVISGDEIRIEPGSITVILGPNGSGKTTFIRGITRTIKPMEGIVTLSDTNIWNIPAKDFSAEVARVSQDTQITWPYSVYEYVSLGRYPYLKNSIFGLGIQDKEIIDQTLDETELTKYRDHSITELSGGELQRVMIARALCHEPSFLILDEPVAHLDLHFRISILNYMKKLSSQGRGVCISLHDLNFAAKFADFIYLFDNGKIIAKGSVENVLKKEIIESVYKTPVKVLSSGDDYIIHPL